MTSEERKEAERLAEKYAAKFIGITRPDGLEGDPTLYDLKKGFKDGFVAGRKFLQADIKAERERFDKLIKKFQRVLAWQADQVTKIFENAIADYEAAKCSK